MPNRLRTLVRLLLPLLAAMALAACAATDYLPVRYQLPATPESLAGRRVALQVVDQRERDSLFGPAAREDFRHFTGNFALRIARGDEKGTVAGAFDLTGLFREALVRRLRAAGATVVPAGTADAPVIEVALERFFLEQETTRWIAQVAYRAELAGTPLRKASQGVSGTEERFRIPGSRDVDKVLGDIFSTTVNRLDLSRLFAEAGV